MALSLALVMTALLMTGASSAYGQTLEAATISKGGGVLPDGSIIVIGQPFVGTMSKADFTIVVVFVPILAACPASTSPVAETLAPTFLQAPLEGGTGADATEIAVNVKNRYVSILAGDAGRSQAIRVRFVDLPFPFDVWNFANTGQDFFVGEPFQVCENSGQTLRADLLAEGEDCGPAGGLSREWVWAAPLLCDKGAAHFMDWTTIDVVHLFHEGLVPQGVYDIQVVDSSCSLQEESGYSTPLTMTQAKWGDVCGPGPGGACTDVSEGSTDVANDVLGLLDKFANINALQKARADIEPGDNGTNNGPDFKVNVTNDVLFALEAFTGAPYPFTPGDPCAPGMTSGKR